MSDYYKMKARLAYPYSATPSSSYRKLIEASTILSPFRKNYLSHRMLNEVQGKTIRRDQQEISHHLKLYSDLNQYDYQNTLNSMKKSRIEQKSLL